MFFLVYVVCICHGFFVVCHFDVVFGTGVVSRDRMVHVWEAFVVFVSETCPDSFPKKTNDEQYHKK